MSETQAASSPGGLSVRSYGAMAFGAHGTFLLLGMVLAQIVVTTTDCHLFLNTRLPLLDQGVTPEHLYALAPWLVLITHGALLLLYFQLAEQVRRAPDGVALFPEPLSWWLVGVGASRLRCRVLEIYLILTVIVFPVLLLIGMQLRFLAFHDQAITWSHRLAVVLDLALIWTIWPRIVHHQGWWNGWKFFLAAQPKNKLNSARSLAALIIEPLQLLVSATFLNLLVVIVVFFLAVIPNGSWEFPGLGFLLDGMISRSLHVQPAPACVIPNGLDLHDRDLRLANLSSLRLPTISLPRANLEGALLEGSYMNGADLSQARLQGVQMAGADLTNANLEQVLAQGSTLTGVQLRDANLRGAKLDRAKLDKAGLQGARLHQASLQGVRLTGTSLKGAQFIQADLRAAEMDYTDLTDANFNQASLRAALLSNAQVENSQFNQADLRETIWLAPKAAGDGGKPSLFFSPETLLGHNVLDKASQDLLTQAVHGPVGSVAMEDYFRALTDRELFCASPYITIALTERFSGWIRFNQGNPEVLLDLIVTPCAPPSSPLPYNLRAMFAWSKHELIQIVQEKRGKNRGMQSKTLNQ